MNILETEFIKGFTRLMMDGYHKGWHERNGGNLSYRMKPEEVALVLDQLQALSDWLPIRTTVPYLAGEFFLVTGTGKFFRNAELDPENTFGIIEIDETGEKYRIMWGFTNEGRPTSELPTHLMNHEVKKQITDGRHRVIYHAHTTNLIALTFVLPLKDEVFTRQLWDMMPECPIVFPEGVGVVDWMVPGGKKIGAETSRLMKEYNIVVWANHGTFCSEETFDFTFGLMDTVEKSAEMLIKVLSINPNKKLAIDSARLQELTEAYNVPINKKFLK